MGLVNRTAEASTAKGVETGASALGAWRALLETMRFTRPTLCLMVLPN